LSLLLNPESGESFPLTLVSLPTQGRAFCFGNITHTILKASKPIQNEVNKPLSYI